MSFLQCRDSGKDMIVHAEGKTGGVDGGELLVAVTIKARAYYFSF